MKFRALLVLSAGVLLCSSACSRTEILLCGSTGDLPCPVGFVCVANRCTPDPGGPMTCAAGEIRCGAACVKLNSDPKNCGGCGIGCDANKVCNGGICTTSCTGDLSNCNGACVDLKKDRAHCGACAKACSALES